MKVIARYKDMLQDFKGNAVASFIIDNFRHIELMKELDEEKTYSVEIKEVKNNRTLAQNRYMWALLHEIDIAINDKPTDEMDIYMTCLERANAKFEYIGALPETEETLRRNFRAIKFIKKIDLNGKEGNMYKVFIGSSKMDTKEMGLLIDTILDLANEVGIETTYWREVLR